MSNPGRDPKEKKCAICEKDMYANEDWAYKRRIGSGARTKWFCSYKCMRAWDAKHETEKKPVIPAEDLEERAPKKQGSRAVLAQKLAKEIKAGHSVTEFLKAEGYKNPYEAYHAVRHYCETKMPEMLLTLKPMKELPKQPHKPRTGRPRKYKAEVELATEVPKVDKAEDPEPVQCIAHVTDAELEEAEKEAADQINRGGVDYQLKIDEERKPEIDPKEAMTGLSKALSDFENHVLTKEKVLRIVDEAALECLEDREYRWGSDTLEQSMFRDAKMNAEAIGMMRLRKAIRKKLGADKE